MAGADLIARISAARRDFQQELEHHRSIAPALERKLVDKVLQPLISQAGGLSDEVGARSAAAQRSITEFHGLLAALSVRVGIGNLTGAALAESVGFDAFTGLMNEASGLASDALRPLRNEPIEARSGAETPLDAAKAEIGEIAEDTIGVFTSASLVLALRRLALQAIAGTVDRDTAAKLLNQLSDYLARTRDDPLAQEAIQGTISFLLEILSRSAELELPPEAVDEMSRIVTELIALAAHKQTVKAGADVILLRMEEMLSAQLAGLEEASRAYDALAARLHEHGLERRRD